MLRGVSKVRLYVLRNKLLIKIAVSYIIAGTMLLSLLSLILYKSFESSTLKQIKNSNEKLLDQSYKLTEAYWVSTFGYMYQEYIGDEVINLGFEGTNLNGNDYGRISKRLMDIVESNNFIKSIYLYNGDEDLVYSNSGTVQTKDAFYDEKFLTSLDKYNAVRIPLLIPRKVINSSDVVEQNLNVISLVFMQKSVKNNVVALIYNLDEQVLQKVVASEAGDNSNQIFIIDNNGFVISHPDTKIVDTNLKDNKYINNILTLKEDRGNFIDEVNGKRVLVNYKKWNNLGWNFISVSDYKSLLQKSSSIQKNAVIIIFIFIILSILASLAFTGTIYLPISKLLKKIKSNNKNQEILGVGELDYLSRTYEYLMENINKNSLSFMDVTIMKKMVLNQLLHSDYNDMEEMKRSLDNVNLKYNSKYYFLIVLRIDDFSRFGKKFNKSDINLYRYAICNICEDVFRAKFEAFEVCETGEDNISVIINLNNLEIASDKINTFIIEIQKTVEDYLQISLTCGISNTIEDINQFGYAYNIAFEATNYRMIYGYKSIIYYLNLKREVYLYPLEIEIEILEALKSVDMDNINKCIKEFITRISKFSYDEMQLSLTQLALSVINFFKRMMSSEEYFKTQLNLDYESINRIIQQWDRMDKAEQWFTELFGKIFIVFKAQRESKYVDIINGIKTYIEENFCKADISIDIISEMVGLSPNYARTLFKDNMDISISNYISKLRLDKAKELLINSNYPGNKISIMIGYNNSSYFYTAFKKYVGKSPDDFRNENKSN